MAIACVDTKSPVFKKKAKELGISEGQLENILHEYNNSPSLQSQMSEDAFISTKLNGVPNNNASDVVAKAWESKYSQPMEYATIQDFNAALQDAVTIFGEQSIGHKETPDGRHILTVAKPFNQEAYQKEIDSIKEKAVADGTFMKAPNGQPTHLTEQQWLQVRTKEFKRWFGDWENDPANSSKVVDENGEPMVVYHGGAPNIEVFRVGSPETTTTGYGTYTEEGTGREIPVDSARTIFFSSNPFVGQSYAQLYALQYFKDLRDKVQNMIGNLHDDVAGFSRDDFKSFDEFYDFLTIISEYNPRFAKLRDYIKELQQKGERLKPNEIAAARQLFIDLRSVLKEYTEDWNLVSSEWDNILTIGKNIIREYLGGKYYAQNIDRLLSGEIPAYLKKEWELFTKIRNHREKYGLPQIGNYDEVHVWLSSGQSFTDSDYILKYNGKELIFDETRGKRDVPISQMSFDEIRQFLQMASHANQYSFWERDADRVKQAFREKSGYYPVFLNIRNPFEHDYEGTHMGQGYKQSPKTSFGYVAARQVDKAIRDGNDGVIYRNLYDPYLADNYGVFSPNQIKSATGNRGTFANEEDNIYFNRQVVPLTQRLNDANIIHKLNGKYYLSVRGEENGIQRRKQELQDFLDRNDYRDIVVDYVHTRRAVEVIFNTPSEHNDLIAREVDRSMSSIRSVMSFLEEKVPAIKGHIHYNTTVEEAGKLLGRDLLPEETSFVRGNQIYLIKGRATREGSIEEVLHIVTNTLLMDNRSLASSLLREAKQLFPQLATEIEQGYKDYGKRERNLELLTQALSRVFRQEYDATKPRERVKVENFLRKFIDWIRNLFGFRTNPRTGNKIIELESLPKVMSLKDFATLINSADGEFSTGERDIVQFNRYPIQEQDRPYITENMVVAGTSKSVTGIEELMKGIEDAGNIQGAGVPVVIPYSSWKSLDMPYESDKAKTLLGTLAVMAYDYNNERFDYNKKNRTISVPRYWYEVAQLLSKHRDVVSALDSIGYLDTNDFADNMSDSDFSIIDGYFTGDYGMLELLFAPKSDLDAFVNAGMISFSYTDSRQGELFDAAGNPIEKVNTQEQQILQPIREANRPFFNRQQLLRRKLDSLYDNEVGLTSEEVDEEATKLVEWISDNITEIQLHPESYYENFGKPKTNDWATEENRKADIDKVTAMSRRDIVANISIKRFIEAYKNQVFIDNEAIDDLAEERDRKKVSLLANNVDALFELGMSTFNDSEGYSVIHNDELGTEEVVETEKEGVTPEGIPEDGAILQEMEGNLEDWMLDKTTIEVLGNATALIRSALGKLYYINEDGSIKTDYLGRRERISQNDAVKSIIRWTQGSLDLGMMVQKLETKLQDNPWISSIIEKLHDNSGKQSDFINQFYTVFQKHFQLFDVIKRDKSSKKNYTMDVNSSPALTDIYNQVVAMQAIDQAPLFTTNGISQSALSQWRDITSKLKANYNVTEQQFNQYKDGFVKRFSALARLLGYEFKDDDIRRSLTYENFKKAIDAASNILGNLTEEASNPEYTPYKYKEGGHYISGYVKDLLRELSYAIEDVTESSFFENGKMRQSYQVPSYASKLFIKLRSDADTFGKTLEEEFGNYEWFRNADGSWRMPWLKELSKMDEETRKKVLVHKVNLNYQGDQYMRGLSTEKYTLSTLTEFASGKESSKSTQIAFYGFPIQSNAATSDFVSFYRYTGDLYKSVIKNGIMSIFGQELSRIQTVLMRDRTDEDADFIAGFDERGRQFCLLDFFNNPEDLVREDGLIDASEAAELSSLIDSKVNGEEIDEARLNSLAKKAIEENFNQKYEQLLKELRSLGLIDAIGNIEGVIAKVSKFPKTQQVEQFIENFVWNDAFAKMNIIEMLVTDPAYYQNDDDFQKRFKQVHSPGTRGNAEATDYEGNRVSDGYFRTTILKDAIINGDALKNNVIENLEVILDRQIEQASESSKDAARALKESVLAQMNDINITDGQALASITGVRKKGFTFGTWSRESENMYNKLRSGEATLSDLRTAFNVKKPFIYTQLSQDVHSVDTPIKTLKVPTQIKDSEYLLVMAGALLQHAETGKPNLLKVLYDVMEETAFDLVDGERVHNNKGIDMFVFESAVKSGLTGASDITSKWINGEYEGSTPEEAEQSLRRALINEIYASDINGDTILGEDGKPMYDDIKVKKIPIEDYAIQNEVPLHMLDHTEIWGSQMRAILESNLPYADYEGNPVKFTYTDSKGEEHSVGREEFVQRYENAVATVVNSAIDRTVNEFGLNGSNIVDTKVAIAKELQREIMSNPQRYGSDLLLACMVNEEGKFRIPPGDPVQSKRIEQLINSIVKNRVNKPKLPGGLAVQVSNFGTSRRLNYRFFMKDGKTLLPTRDEWLAKNPDKTEADYTAFASENQGGFAYEEHYSPAYTRDLYRMLADHNGSIDLEAVEMLDENLLLSIDKRTPTEDYYSITIAKIEGFLPKEAGDGDMGPSEHPGFNDSDFDVDKQSKWMKKFRIVKTKAHITNKMLKDRVPELENIKLTDEERAEVKKEVENQLSWSGLTEEQYNKKYPSILARELEKARQKKIYNVIKDFRNVPFGTPSRENGIDRGDLYRALKRAYVKLAFRVEYPTEGEGAAMNDAWEMSKAVLQHESNAGKKFSPGGPEAVTHIGYFVGALKTGLYTREQLSSMSTKELGKIAKGASMNLVYFANQMEYYRRNNDASSNLGIFAVAASAHNILEGQGYAVYNPEEFTIAGKTFGTEVEIDALLDNLGQRISKTLGANVAAAADAAKTPSHAFLNINKNTINEFIFLVRSGMNLEDACLFIASRPIEGIIRAFNAANVSQYKSLDSIIEERINKLKEDNNITEDSQIYDEELDKEEIMSTFEAERVSPMVEFKSLLMFQRLRRLTGGMRMATFATRYNSVSSAVGPLIVDNLSHKHQADMYGAPDYNGSDTEHTPVLLQRKLEILYARDNNREVHLGDEVVDADGNNVVITPENLEVLKEQGILNVNEDYQEVFLSDILDAHPMLKAFSRGYAIVDRMFNILDMPAASAQFSNILNHDRKVSRILYGDTKLLSMFSDFFQSYLMIASDAISTENSKFDGPEYYLRRFPELFLKARDRYKGNALIDAIRVDVSDSGVISLKLNTTGLKDKERGKLRAAWNQLYAQSPKLAIDLFKYNFWRGGIGFSPKTFINMLPIQMKEKIDGYIDTFDDMPDVTYEHVIDQFFRNNMYDGKLVRMISIEDGNVNVTEEGLEFEDSKFDNVSDLPYIKVSDASGVLHMYKQDFVDAKNHTVTFQEVSPLGNGGEFIEISKETIKNPLFQSNFAEQATEETPNTDRESPVTPEPVAPVKKTDAQIEAEIQEFLQYLKAPNGNYFPGVVPQGMANLLRRAKQGKIQLDMAIQKNNLKQLFEANGIKYSESEIDKIVKLMC